MLNYFYDSTWIQYIDTVHIVHTYMHTYYIYFIENLSQKEIRYLVPIGARGLVDINNESSAGAAGAASVTL